MEFKLTKKPIGEKNPKNGRYEKWSFQICGVEIATLSKSTSVVCSCNGRLITQPQTTYGFYWRTSNLENIFFTSFLACSSSSLPRSTPDLWNEHSALYPMSKLDVIKRLNEVLTKKGLTDKVI